jgi:hypothetical protein
MINHILNNEQILAIHIPNEFSKDGIEFFTPNEFPQQVGYMKRKKGYNIEPHLHSTIKREIFATNEVLFIKSGKIRVDFYDEKKVFLKSLVIKKGDTLLLISGGHGFEMLEESEIIEIKQGPYIGEDDKNKFKPSEKNNIK